MPTIPADEPALFGIPPASETLERWRAPSTPTAPLTVEKFLDGQRHGAREMERLEADIAGVEAKIRANHQASESPPPSPEQITQVTVRFTPEQTRELLDSPDLTAAAGRIEFIPGPPESPPRSPPRRRPSLWSRLVQHLCPHPTTTSARVPGAIPPVYQCHCWSCDRRWAEAGE